MKGIPDTEPKKTKKWRWWYAVRHGVTLIWYISSLYKDEETFVNGIETSTCVYLVYWGRIDSSMEEE